MSSHILPAVPTNLHKGYGPMDIEDLAAVKELLEATIRFMSSDLAYHRIGGLRLVRCREAR